MKNGKKPTVRETQHIKSMRLNPSNWLISKKTSTFWLIVHRESGNVREIPAP